MFPLSGESSLFILLPPTAKLSDLQLVEGKMTDKAVSQMVEQMNQVSPQATEVTLPKIKLDVRTEMNTLLRKIGLFVCMSCLCLSVCLLAYLLPDFWNYKTFVIAT